MNPVNKIGPAFPLGLRLYLRWRDPGNARELAEAYGTVVAQVPPFVLPWNRIWYTDRPDPRSGLDVSPFNDPRRAKPCWQYVLQLQGAGGGYLVYPHWAPTMMAGKACEEGECDFYVPKSDVIALRQLRFTYAQTARWRREHVLVVAADRADFDRYVARYGEGLPRLHIHVDGLGDISSWNDHPVIFTPRASEHPSFTEIDEALQQHPRLEIHAPEECTMAAETNSPSSIADAHRTHDIITDLERQRDAALRQVQTMSRSRDALIGVLKSYAVSCKHAQGPGCRCTNQARAALDLLGVSYED